MVVSMHITEKNVTQSGGMKILVKNERGEDVVVRKIVDMRQFISIFSNTIHIDILSVDSLTGFILRITHLEAIFLMKEMN